MLHDVYMESVSSLQKINRVTFLRHYAMYFVKTPEVLIITNLEVHGGYALVLDDDCYYNCNYYFYLELCP